MPYAPKLAAEPTAEQLIDALHGAGEYLLGLQRQPSDSHSESDAEDMAQAIRWIEVHDAVLTTHERSERAAATRAVGAGPALATAPPAPDTRSLGERVLSEDDAHRRITTRGGDGVSVSQRALVDSATAPGIPVGTPSLAYQRRRRLFIRDMIGVQPTNLSTIPYFRELNSDTTEAGMGMVAEGAAKPELSALFVRADAPVRKVAGWVPVTTEALEDSTTLRGYIDGRLGYMVLLREEEQVLNGNGTGSNLLGIRQTPGLQTQAAVAGDPLAAIGLAIGKVEAADGEADGIALHPTEYWTLVTTRHANQLDVGQDPGMGPFAAAPPNLWGMQTIRTRSMPAFTGTAGTARALVGSFRIGSTIFERSEAVIRTGWQGTQFIENKVTLLGEERIAFAVHSPQTFAEVTLR